MLLRWLRALWGSPNDATAYVADAQASLKEAREWIAGYEADHAKADQLTPESIQKADQTIEEVMQALAYAAELLQAGGPPARAI